MKTTKESLARDIGKAMGLPATQVGPLLDAYLDAIKKALAEGSDIEIRGFGSFRRRLRKGHPALNPHTGAKMVIPEHYVVKFRPAKDMKRVVDS